MAEIIAIIGLTASILTLVEGASKALKFTETLRKAPDEMASLQHELASFKKAIQNITAFQGDREILNSIVENELSKSKDVIQKLHTFIDTSLLRKGLPSRRRWAKKLGRMKQLREDLRVGRNQLVLGLIVANSAYSSKAVEQLDTITHQLSVSHSSAETIEKSLHQIYSQNSSTQEIVRRSANLASETKDIVLSTVSNTRKPCEPEEEQLSAVARSLTVSRKANIEVCRRERPSVLEEYRNHLAPARPSSPFEQSANFFPAQYTTSTRVRQVRVLAMFEKSCSTVQRVNEYHTLFSLCPQRRLSITISVSTSRSSTYWSPFKLSTSRSIPENFLPKPLESKLCEIISESDNPGDYIEMALDFSHNNALQKQTLNITQISYTSGRQILDFARDLGCPMYYEREISPLYDCQNGIDRRATIVSGLANGQLCREERLFAMGVCMEETKWKLALYQCLRNSPHIPNLLGVVTDNSFHCVKSILTDTVGSLSPTPLNKLITNSKTSSQRISLAQRLSWARQIVTGLHDLHQKGFIIGRLELPVLGVNSGNEIQFLDYRKKARLTDLRYPFIAPELRGSSQVDADVLFTSRTDLFQLGLVLWQIAQHKLVSEAQAELCPIEKCTCLAGRYQNNMHIGAIELPPVDKCFPDWYQKVVNVCRSEKPRDRWTASELMSLFPSNESFSMSTSDALVFNESWDPVTFCCVCRSRICTVYKCKACGNGDFDLCSVCFNAGEHCTVKDHFVEEMNYREESLDWQSTGRHYSNVHQDSGQRIMLYLG